MWVVAIQNIGAVVYHVGDAHRGCGPTASDACGPGVAENAVTSIDGKPLGKALHRGYLEFLVKNVGHLTKLPLTGVSVKPRPLVCGSGLPAAAGRDLSLAEGSQSGQRRAPKFRTVIFNRVFSGSFKQAPPVLASSIVNLEHSVLPLCNGEANQFVLLGRNPSCPAQMKAVVVCENGFARKRLYEVL